MLPPNDELSRLWRAEVSLGCRWRLAPNQAGVLGGAVPAGEAGGLFVMTERWPQRRAYMKPRRRDPDPRKARAAREKICADLAHDLGVTVPPVVLAQRDDAPPDEENAVCVSLVLYPRQFPWEQVKRYVDAGPAGTELIRHHLPVAAAHALAFDTWVGQTDHNDHPHNIVFGYVPGPTVTIQDAAYVFLDYAFALGWGGVWEGDGWGVLGQAPFPPAMTGAVDKAALGAILDRIESISDDTIKSVVERIPSRFLAPAEGTLIIEGLVRRRSLVRQLLTPSTTGAA